MKTSFNLVAKIRNQVGESPIWDDKSKCLYWVDIIGKSIHKYDFFDDKTTIWKSEDFPTAIALRQFEEGAIIALGGCVSLFDFKTGDFTKFCNPDPTAGNRLNEGRCDPSGRLWVGSMRNNLKPDGSGRDIDRHSGALFRIDADGTVSQHTEFEFGISNTMAWSPDQKIFYFGDSLRNVIFAFDYDADTGDLHNRRILIDGYPHGAPDGSAIDTHGCLWNARFGGSRIIRITPDGRIDKEIILPVTNPTSCTFGGADRSTLFITSAKFGLTDEQLKSNPQEGALISMKTEFEGMPDFKFRG
ncbi:MAG: SMP-30/gluconolactonase/LRE family protein [Rhizobiales bacterium]|nr:SMP-30/gluconolactonase/LRE family protein [Hyphomicrobiales bacterium]